MDESVSQNNTHMIGCRIALKSNIVNVLDSLFQDETIEMNTPQGCVDDLVSAEEC